MSDTLRAKLEKEISSARINAEKAKQEEIKTLEIKITIGVLIYNSFMNEFSIINFRTWHTSVVIYIKIFSRHLI